jgi:hypothetical protein
VNVLLTHEPACDSGRLVHSRYAGQGSRDVARLLTDLRPRYHFTGHWHEPGTELLAPSGVHGNILHTVNFTDARPNARSMGVLTWTSAMASRWEWLEAPWLAEYGHRSWRAMMQSENA